MTSNEIQSARFYIEMQKLVSSLMIMENNLRNWHWHIVGPHFAVWHEYFGEQYKWMINQTDDFAERMRYFNYRVKLYEPVTEDFPVRKRQSSSVELEKDAVKDCLEDYKKINREVLDNLMPLADSVTEDMLEQFLTTIQEQIWHIESHLSDGGY